MTKATINSVIGVAVAVIAAVQAILVTQAVESAGLAAQITTGLAGVLAAYHGGSFVANNTAPGAPTSSAAPVVSAPVAAVTVPPSTLGPAL